VHASARFSSRRIYIFGVTRVWLNLSTQREKESERDREREMKVSQVRSIGMENPEQARAETSDRYDPT